MEKQESPIEKLRKPISRLVALALLCVGALTIPVGFGNIAHEALEYLGYGLLIVAGLGRVWCTIYIAGRKDRVLCVDGPYSICRNPLYLFSFIGVIGVFLALQSPLLTVIAGGIYLIYYRGVMQSEEVRLAALFGSDFFAYQSAVPRFWPAFGNYYLAQEERIISTRIVERGLREVVWFFAIIIFIDQLEGVHLAGKLVLVHLPF